MEHSCLGFAIECDTLWKGAGVTIMGLTLFIFSIYLLLTAIVGRWLGFLVLMVAFSGWMVLQSSLWLFGFWSQGLETPTNLGPRGAEPAWVALEAAVDETSAQYATYETWPGDPWSVPDETDPDQSADVQSASGAVTAFLAEQTNEELGLAETDATAIQGSQFSIDSIRFARRGRGHEARGRAVALHRRRSTLDGVALLRLRAACLATRTCSWPARSWRSRCSCR